MVSLRSIFTVTGLYPNRDGTDIERRHLGKFFHDGERVAVLEDHRGLLHDLPQDGPLDEHAKRVLGSLFRSQSLHIQSAHDRLAQHTPESTPPADVSAVKDPKPDRPAVFDYRRAGMHSVHTLEVHDGRAVLDGAPLTPEESHRVLEQVRTGVASLRHRRPAGSLQKQEEALADLLKAEGGAPGKSLAESMEAIRQLVAQGHLPQDHYDQVRKELFEDSMVPGLGNKKALLDHLARPQPGVYASLDGNGVRAVNSVHGHPGGDQAIVGMGNSIRRAIDKTVGSDSVKAFRAGGDEFVLHAQHPEHLHQVLRQLRAELESIPAIGGTHRLSMSVGLGPDYPSADRSLYAAKTQKVAAMRAAGRNPDDENQSPPHSLYVHSLIPGQEGAVPTEIPHPLHGLGLTAPPAGAPSPVAGPPASGPVSGSNPGSGLPH